MQGTRILRSHLNQFNIDILVWLRIVVVERPARDDCLLGRATTRIVWPEKLQGFAESALEVVAEKGVKYWIDGRVGVTERSGNVNVKPYAVEEAIFVGGAIAGDHLVDPIGHPDDVNEDDRDH